MAAPELAQRIHLVFEICRLQHSVEDAAPLGLQVITPSGYSGVWIDARRKTSRNEPVYYTYGGEEGRHMGLVAHFRDAPERRAVFMRPKSAELKFGVWSRWLEADALTDDQQVESRVLRQLEFHKLKPEPAQFFIRYRLMSFVDYLGTVRNKSLSPELAEGGACGD